MHRVPTWVCEGETKSAIWVSELVFHICRLTRVPLSTCNSARLCLPVSSGPCSRQCVCMRADCLICCCRAIAGGLQRISFIRLIRVEEWSDGRQEGEEKDRRGDGAFSGKHTPGAVQSQHLNTRVLKAAAQLFTAKCTFQQALTPFKRSAHPKDPF